jgi:hypothetical protein
MTWKDVLDVKPGKRYADIRIFARAAELLGYKFIAWKGRVYFLIDSSEVMDTGVTVDELDVQVA